jgi:hypothetical protein
MFVFVVSFLCFCVFSVFVFREIINNFFISVTLANDGKDSSRRYAISDEFILCFCFNFAFSVFVCVFRQTADAKSKHIVVFWSLDRPCSRSSSTTRVVWREKIELLWTMKIMMWCVFYCLFLNRLSVFCFLCFIYFQLITLVVFVAF